MSERPEPEHPGPELAPAPPMPAEPGTEPAAITASTFRLLLVPGVVPASWLRTWSERMRDVPAELVHAEAAEAAGLLAAGDADAALLRLPVDRDLLSAIPLYVETSVVVLPKDHLLTALDEIGPDDLAEETLLVPADDVIRWADAPGEESALPIPATTADAVELVAAGVGLLVVPQSLARLHHRKDLTYRPVTDAPTSQVALGWLRDRDGDPLVEEMIGVVRGRTVNSSRGAGAGAAGARAGEAGRDGRGKPSGGKTGGGERGGRGRGAGGSGGSGSGSGTGRGSGGAPGGRTAGRGGSTGRAGDRRSGGGRRRGR
jgi:hypothetical protein